MQRLRYSHAWIVATLAVVTIPLLLVFSGGRTRLLAENTLMLSGAVAAISILIGAPLALLLVRTDLPGRKLFVVLLAAMLLMPLYLHAAAWQAAFGVQGWLTTAGILPPIEGWTGAIGVHVLAAVPWVVLIVGIGMRLVEAELEQQALLDASALQVVSRITLRRACGAVAAAALWVAATTASEMTVTDLYQVRTFAEEIYTQLAIGDEPSWTWPALPSVLAVAWLVVAALVVIAELAPRDWQTSYPRTWVFCLGRAKWPIAVAVLLLMLALVGVPAASLLYKAGLNYDASPRTWSPIKLASIITRSYSRFRQEFQWSLIIGGLAATAAVAIGFMLGWIARRGGVRALFAWLPAALALALPGPLLGLGLIKLLDQPDSPLLIWLYDHSILAPWLAQVVKALPLAILILWHALRTMPGEQVQAAAIDGASTLATLRRIVLPARWQAIIVAWLVALAIALGELSASILVMPPGVTTLSIQIFNLIHYGVEDTVAGICLALALAMLFIGLMILAVLRWPGGLVERDSNRTDAGA